jgi:hypothetical protein
MKNDTLGKTLLRNHDREQRQCFLRYRSPGQADLGVSFLAHKKGAEGQFLLSFLFSFSRFFFSVFTVFGFDDTPSVFLIRCRNVRRDFLELFELKQVSILRQRKCCYAIAGTACRD